MSRGYPRDQISSMSEHRWIIDPALGLTLAVCVVAVFIVWIDYTRLVTAQSTSERLGTIQPSVESRDHVEEACFGLGGGEWRGCALNVIQREFETGQNTRDLHAQERMARWAFWMFVAAGIGTLVAGFGLILLRRTWVETKRTADVTRTIGEAQVRAYLRVERARVQQDGNKITVEVTVKNYGQSPARFVHFVPEIVYNADVTDKPGSQRARFAYANGWDLGDIPANSSVDSGTVSFSDIEYSEAAVRNSDGTPIVVLVNIGVFAADVFGVEILDGVGASVYKFNQVHPSMMAEENRKSSQNFRRILITDGLHSSGWCSLESKGNRPTRK